MQMVTKDGKISLGEEHAINLILNHQSFMMMTDKESDIHWARDSTIEKSLTVARDHVLNDCAFGEVIYECKDYIKKMTAMGMWILGTLRIPDQEESEEKKEQNGKKVREYVA